jgi:hypothetical protein
MSDDRKSKMLESVRALLAKADSTQFEAEAETFRQKADEIMTAYAIEQWQVEEAQAGVSARPKPEVRNFNTDWWYDSPRYAELNRLFYSVSFHCRTVVAYRGWSGRSCPVIGLPSDLDYLDLLFTHLMLQMGRNLERHYNSAKPLDENVYDMRMAGMGWMRITKLCWEAGTVDPPRGKAGKTREYDATTHSFIEEPITTETPWDGIPNASREAIKNRLANLNRAYSRRNNLDRNYVRPEVYQRSYAMGFVEEVRARLREMRRNRSRSEGGSGMEVAIRDIRQQADDLYGELWPAPEPDPNAKASKAVSRELATDIDAYMDGKAAGAEAEIAGPSSGGLRKTPELPS